MIQCVSYRSGFFFLKSLENSRFSLDRRTIILTQMREPEDLIPEEERSFYVNQVKRQFLHGNICYLRHPLRRKDGAVIQVICNGERHFDSSVRAFRSTILVFEVSPSRQD